MTDVPTGRRRRDSRSGGTVLSTHVRWSRGIAAPAPEPAPDAATSPRAMAAALEGAPRLPDGTGERFAGYGVLGMPFASGDVFALRRFPASSIGPAYTSVWHRDPDGRWTFYTDGPPRLGCQRYAGAAVDRSVVTPIHVTWTAADAFTVAAPRVSLAWSATLAATRATRVVDAIAARLPARAWREPAVLGALGLAQGLLLGAGRLSLHGRTPSGHRYRLVPRRVWRVAESRVRLGGRVLGPPAPRGEPIAIGDFRLSRVGLFAFAEAHFAPG